MTKFKYFICLAIISLNLFIICKGAQIKVTDRVYFDIMKDNQPMGRIIIGLFGDVAPKTVENFKTLATTGIDGKTYCGTKFHRVIKRFMIQGGDVVYNNGLGSISIYGTEFEDENLQTEFKISGLISMANKGKDTNGCQFFITTIPTPWLNGLHTVFGKVVEGQQFVHLIEHESTDIDDHPRHDIFISDCGLIDTPKPYFVSDEPYDLWAWIRASAVPLTSSFLILALFQWFIRKLDI